MVPVPAVTAVAITQKPPWIAAVTPPLPWCTLQAAAYLAIKNEADAGGQGEQQQQLAVQGQQAPAGSGYLCPSCVHSAGDACPLDMLQLHAAVLADIKPRRPRSAADIHAAELTRKVWPAACGVASGGAAGVPRLLRLKRAIGVT